MTEVPGNDIIENLQISDGYRTDIEEKANFWKVPNLILNSHHIAFTI